jgi:ribulose-phosphate 3-epimerase
MMEKVKCAHEWKTKNGAGLDIEVDGGINSETARLSIENGANVLVAGTSIFRSKDYAEAIRQLRGIK